MEDLDNETFRLLNAAVSDIFLQLQGQLPKFDSQYKRDNIRQAFSELLLSRYIEWNRWYVYMHEGPLASADKDPPSDFVTDIRSLVNKEKGLEDHAQEVSGAMSQVFWDVACMAIHPELFDYPTENSGRGVRKTTPTAIAPSLGPPSFEEALGLVVTAFCSLDSWLVRFSKTKLSTLKKRLTVTVHPSETASVQRILCPRHFSRDEETMVPSDELLQRATNGDDPYLTSLFKLEALQLPHTTLTLLKGVKELGETLVKKNQKARSLLERNWSTSTTKMPKEQCAGCGTKEETEKSLLKCSRCLLVRYCTVDCQKRHWCVHKKVCASKQVVLLL
jgi:hypothetical protein